MKDSDRFNQYRTGMNVVFKYVPDFSSPIMIEGTIRNIVMVLVRNWNILKLRRLSLS